MGGHERIAAVATTTDCGMSHSVPETPRTSEAAYARANRVMPCRFSPSFLPSVGVVGDHDVTPRQASRLKSDLSVRCSSTPLRARPRPDEASVFLK